MSGRRSRGAAPKPPKRQLPVPATSGSRSLAQMPVTLIGHPFATVGVGEQLRSHVRACLAAGLDVKVLDIFSHAARSDAEHLQLIDAIETRDPGDGIRIFHVNGDEVERVQARLSEMGHGFDDGYNIIVPAWELPRYPDVWGVALRRFDEVWALSRFIQASLATIGIDSVHIGQSVEVPTGFFLPRRHFGIRESAFVLLHFFDLTSHAARKNPEAAIALWSALRASDRFADIQLVLKVKDGGAEAEEWGARLRRAAPEALVLAEPLSALETRSLINACDCFVSLHRAEGFGRGAGEAMFLGRLALATGWSGNMDYMTAENALVVDHGLVPVPDGAYPHSEGQSWAEPDVAHAATLVQRVIADPVEARRIAANGRRIVRLNYADRPVGLRILRRLEEIAATRPGRREAA